MGEVVRYLYVKTSLKVFFFKQRIKIFRGVRISVGREHTIEGIDCVRTLRQDGIWSV